jgi:8-oxo-dGTP pyrophosphatase MutT (NUDIX family)
MSSDDWPVRITARVLLLDRADRVLLLKGRMPRSNRPGGWFTVGGGVEDGETLEETAVREIVEESGLTDAVLGPLVWIGEVRAEWPDSGERMLARDHFFLARTEGGAVTRDGWQAHEHDLVDDMRWWCLADLKATADEVYPPILPEMLEALLRDGPPATPIRLPDRHVVFDA